MKISDLKDGMVVVRRDGKKYVIIQGVLYTKDFLKGDRLLEYNSDLTYHDSRRVRDIMKIYETPWAMREEHHDEQIWERPMDWSKVEIDTPILVSHTGDKWYKRHFAGLKDDMVKAWAYGETMWTASNEDSVTCWEFAKLAKGEYRNA